MVMINKKIPDKYVHIPDGTYAGYVESVKYKKNVKFKHKMSDIIILTFQIPFKGGWKCVRESYSIPYRDNDRTAKAIKALLGNLPENLDTDKLIDSECYIRIRQRPYRGGFWSGIEGLIPIDDTPMHSKKNINDTKKKVTLTSTQVCKPRKIATSYINAVPDSYQGESDINHVADGYHGDPDIHYTEIPEAVLQEYHFNEKYQQDDNGATSCFDLTEPFIKDINFSDWYQQDDNGATSCFDLTEPFIKAINFNDWYQHDVNGAIVYQ